MASYVMPITLMALAFAFGGLAIVFIITFIRSHRLRLRYIVNDKKYVEDYWVIEKSDRDTGDIYWSSVFFQKNVKCERPPDHILDVGKKGKFYAELYVTGRGADGTLEGIWINDSVDVNKDNILMDDGVKISETFKPFTATQRAFATRQFKKADERRSKRWDLQKIANITFMGLFIITILVGLIFLPDILDKQRQLESTKLSWMEKAEKITEKQLAITSEMGIRLEDYDVVVSPRVEQQQNTIITTNEEVQPMEE